MMKPFGKYFLSAALGMVLFIGFLTEIQAQRLMENLGRGVVAIHQGDGNVFVGWRLLGTDPDEIAFNLYRSPGDENPAKLNDTPITTVTHFVDTGADLSRETSYFVRPVLNGVEQGPSASFTLSADSPAQSYISIPLQTPDGTRPNDASVGDLDGDGEYEIVLHQAPRGRDNSHSGVTGEPIFEAYKLDGTRLWRINLGKNIREGAHYTQFMVYDLDGDGKAEFACKTADGTVDGRGKVIGDPDADYREMENRRARGKILRGPEYLTIFDGLTGAELATVDYIPGRHPETHSPTPEQQDEIWGDDYGNRMDRFLACVAYLDGTRPSLVMCRGYYTRTVLAAWDWRDGKLTSRWVFDSDETGPAGRRNPYRGQGNHSIAVADVDADGKDEIIYGSCVIDDDGAGLYSTRLGHGDAQHTTDHDPSRPGLEIFSIHENPRHDYGIEMRDARTGEILWGKPSEDVGRGLAIDIDPRHAGSECWASGPGLGELYNVKGEVISDSKPRSCNFAVWWDGDVLREILDRNRVTKWNWEEGSESLLVEDEDCVSNNGTKATPTLCADILGDWREEVIWRTRDGNELRIYTTTIPTEHRFYTLMHDPTYRLSIAWQNVAYNQPPHPGFHLGQGMAKPPRPDITLVGK